MGIFSKNKLILKLEKNMFKPGETIEGTVKLDLTESLKGRKLEVALIGAVIKTESGHSYHHFDDDNSFTTAQPFYFLKKTLDGEKEYDNDEYQFEIKIPPNVHKEEPKFEGALGKLMAFSNKLGGHPPYIEWYIKAQLDVPLKIDLRVQEKIELT